MTCQKVPYSTKKEAKKDIKIIKSQQKYRSKKFCNHPKSGRKMYAYFCFFCQKWHLSSLRKRNKQ